MSKVWSTQDKRKEAYEKRLLLQQEVGKLNIDRAKLEARVDNIDTQAGEREMKINVEELKAYIDMGTEVLKRRQKKVKARKAPPNRPMQHLLKNRTAIKSILQRDRVVCNFIPFFLNI